MKFLITGCLEKPRISKFTERTAERFLGRLPVLIRKTPEGILGKIARWISIRIPREKILKNFQKEFWEDSQENVLTNIWGVFMKEFWTEVSRRIEEVRMQYQEEFSVESLKIFQV